MAQWGARRVCRPHLTTLLLVPTTAATIPSTLRAIWIGTICPLGAHVRKVNPRAVGTDLGVPSLTLKHRILRRGIAYGAPLPDGMGDDRQDRGLLFLSYQVDIVSVSSSSSSPNGPTDPTFLFEATGPGVGADPNGDGYDLVIGQQRTGDRARFLVIRTDTADLAHLNRRLYAQGLGGGYRRRVLLYTIDKRNKDRPRGTLTRRNLRQVNLHRSTLWADVPPLYVGVTYKTGYGGFAEVAALGGLGAK